MWKKSEIEAFLSLSLFDVLNCPGLDGPSSANVQTDLIDQAQFQSRKLIFQPHFAHLRD